jgi:hypothetical protein
MVLVALVADGRMEQPAGSEHYARLLASAGEVIYRASKVAPVYADIVKDLATGLSDTATAAEGVLWKGNHPKSRDVILHLSALAGASGRWIRSPDDFKRGQLTIADFLELASRRS